MQFGAGAPSAAVYYGFFSTPARNSPLRCCSLSCVRLDARLDCPPLPCLHSPSWITASSLLILPCFVFFESLSDISFEPDSYYSSDN